MSGILKISLKQLIYRKSKYIAVAAAIVLTSVLFTTIFNLGFEILDNVKYMGSVMHGSDAMVDIKVLTGKEYEELSDDDYIRNVSHRVFVGFPGGEALDGIRTEMVYADDENAESVFQSPVVGNMPREYNEIVTSEKVLQRLGVSASVGSKAEIEYVVNGQSRKTEFVISGISETRDFAPSDYIFVSEEFQQDIAPVREDKFSGDYNDVCGYIMMDFDFHHAFNVEKQYSEYMQRHGYDEDSFIHGMSGGDEGQSADIIGIIFFAFIIFVVFFAAYIIINNIFYINLKLDLHSSGLLKAIGATNKQLKSIIMLQGMIITAVFLPVGLLAGYIITQIAVPGILNSFLYEFDRPQIIFHAWGYVASIIMTFLAVISGCNKPGKFIKNISPIAAINYVEKESNSKGRFNYRFRKNIFYLALENVLRDKKQMCVIVVSLSIAILIANFINCFTASLDEEKYVAHFINSDFSIGDEVILTGSAAYEDTSYIDYERFADMKYIPAIDKYSKVYWTPSQNVDVDDEQFDRISDSKDITVDFGEEDFSRTRQLYVDIFGISTDVLQTMNLEDSFDTQAFAGGEGCIAYWNFGEEGDLSPYRIGEKVSVEMPDGSSKGYEVLAVGKLPESLGANYSTQWGGKIVIGEQEYLRRYDNNTLMRLIIDAKKGQADKAEKYIDERIAGQDGIAYATKSRYIKDFDDMVLGYRIIGAGLVIIIAVIGLLNYVNTVITNIIVRKRELAVMESIGMTGRQMSRMLLCENLLYVFMTIIFSIAFFSTFGVLIIKLYADGMWYFTYRFDIDLIIYMIPPLCLFAVIITRIIYKRMRRESLIQRIKVE